MDDLEKELREEILRIRNGYFRLNDREKHLLDLHTRCLEAIAWRSVGDELPDKYQEVWAIANGVVQKTVCRWTGGTWEYYDNEWHEIDDSEWPTKWMPLPITPKGED